MNIVGIDPGKTGGMVLLGPSGGVIGKMVLPIDPAGDLDRHQFIDMLPEWDSWNEFHVVMERVIPFALNAKGALQFGRQLGTIEQIIWERGWKLTLVEAAKWSKEIHQGIASDLKPKAKSLIAVQRLFPRVNLLASESSKKPHEGLVDALLIAEFGRRKLLGSSQTSQNPRHSISEWCVPPITLENENGL